MTPDKLLLAAPRGYGAGVDRAVAAFPESEGIVDANIEALETLGATGWSALQARCRAKAEQAIDQGT